jgi:hypothetical protein
MTETLAKLAPFAIAGALVPTWTTHVILLIATRRPVVNPLSFVFGNFSYRMLLGIAVLFFVSAEAVQDLVNRAKELPQSIVLMIGFGLVAASILLFVTRPRAEQAASPPKWLTAVESVPPALAFGWGFLDVAAPGVQYVYFLGGLGVIKSAGMSSGQELVWLVCFSAFLQIMLLSPIALYLLFRSHADRILDSLREWLARWGNVLIGGILLMFGVLMVLQGFGVL